MGRRSRQRQRQRGARPTVASTEYPDAHGNVLTLRDRLSDGTVRELGELAAAPAATQEDRWQRRSEFLFERLAVSWTISGLPLTGQKELLGRYRMADAEMRRWVGETVDSHVRTHHPGVVD